MVNNNVDMSRVSLEMSMNAVEARSGLKNCPEKEADLVMQSEIMHKETMMVGEFT